MDLRKVHSVYDKVCLSLHTSFPPTPNKNLTPLQSKVKTKVFSQINTLDLSLVLFLIISVGIHLGLAVAMVQINYYKIDLL